MMGRRWRFTRRYSDEMRSAVGIPAKSLQLISISYLLTGAGLLNMLCPHLLG